MNCNDELNACGREPERLLREPYRATRIWRSILAGPLPSIPYPGPRWPGRKRGTAVVSNMVPRGLSVRYENCQNCGGASSPGDAVSRLDAHFPAVLEQRLGPTEGFSSAVTGLNVTAMASASRIRRGNASRSIAVDRHDALRPIATMRCGRAEDVPGASEAARSVPTVGLRPSRCREPPDSLYRKEIRAC